MHPVEVREFPAPELEQNSAVLAVELSEVCGTDVYLQRGLLDGVPYPLIPGHVSVGHLVEDSWAHGRCRRSSIPRR